MNAARTSPTTLLVVEDEIDIARLIQTKFRSAGYDVTVANDGPTGLEQARALQPEVILLDVMLPGMSGYDICAAIRHEQGRHPVIVVLSARSQEVDRRRGLDAGADSYVVKPFRPSALLLLVQELLDARTSS